MLASHQQRYNSKQKVSGPRSVQGSHAINNQMLERVRNSRDTLMWSDRHALLHKTRFSQTKVSIDLAAVHLPSSFAGNQLVQV